MVLTTLYKHQWCSLPKQTFLMLLLLCLFMLDHAYPLISYINTQWQQQICLLSSKTTSCCLHHYSQPKTINHGWLQSTNKSTKINRVHYQNKPWVLLLLFWMFMPNPLIIYIDAHSDQIETNKHRFFETWLKQTNNIRIDGLHRNK